MSGVKDGLSIDGLFFTLPSRGLVIQDLEVVYRFRDSGCDHHCRRRYLHGGHGKEAGSGDHYDNYPDLDYSQRYPGTVPGANVIALLLCGESYRHRRRLRPHPLLVFQQLVGPMGKIRFSNHHTQLWKNRGKQEVKTIPAFVNYIVK